VYRGAKLTKRAWADIANGTYVAQALVPPTVRTVTLAGGTVTLKYDLRMFSYDAKPILLAARVYQGQTTNFRTEGGGFAPAFVVSSAASGSKHCPAELQGRDH